MPFLFMTILLSPLPQVARVEVGADSNKSFRFDWDSNDSEGQPYANQIVLVIFRFINANDTNDRRWVGVDVVVSPGETKILVKEALKGMPGGDWDMQVTILDISGQPSLYSEVTDETRLTVITTRPSTVKNVRLVQ